jgi:hypothetical protein
MLTSHKFFAETSTLRVPAVRKDFGRSARIEIFIQKFFNCNEGVEMERTSQSGFCGK